MVNPVGVVEELSLTLLGEIHCSFINQVLNLVLQSPAVDSVMSRTIRVVLTSFVVMIVRSMDVGVPGRSP